MANSGINLYSLLPALYRERDAQQNYPLQALLEVLSNQGSLVEADIQQLYENLFIETCDDWVIPYIGDLVSNNLLYDPNRIPQPDTAKTLFTDLAGSDLLPPIAVRVRADVAKTIYYRRRKGTPAMLEEMAGDVTGWPAHVVEFLQVLGWNQCVNHLRPQCRWTDVRSVNRMELVDGAFEQAMHTVDVRMPAQDDGHYNIRNIGFFFWRLQSYPLSNVPARKDPSVAWGYSFSPLGNPAPLFTQQRPMSEGSGLSREIDMPAPIRRPPFYMDLLSYGGAGAVPAPPAYTQYYGDFASADADPAQALASLYVRVNGTGVAPSAPGGSPGSFAHQVVCMRLDPWPATRPAGKIVGIDVVNGRLALGTGWTGVTAVDVSYWYGFSSGLGGGGYDRRKWLIDPGAYQPVPLIYTVQQDGASGQFTKVTDALNAWAAAGRPNAIIRIQDSRNYALPASIKLTNDGWLAIEADNLQRPLLQTGASGFAIEVAPPAVASDPDRNAGLTLSGIVLEGFVTVVGDMGLLRLFHSTLIPGLKLRADGSPASAQPSLIVKPSAGTQKINLQFSVEAAFCILGALEVPEASTGITLLDCIVQAAGGGAKRAVYGSGGTYGPPLQTERSTIFGWVLVKSLQASETLFASTVAVQRTQDGCVRFCYVPSTSDTRTPRRYKCQPDLEIASETAAALQADSSLSQAAQDKIASGVEGWLVPSFTTLVYGMPGFAQLLLSCPAQISTGAQDGSEMGAFCHLKQPQRASNLQIRLEEYLPFGLEAGITYVT